MFSRYNYVEPSAGRKLVIETKRETLIAKNIFETLILQEISQDINCRSIPVTVYSRYTLYVGIRATHNNVLCGATYL